MNKTNHILAKGQTIDNQYKVTFFLKKGSYAESYRVTNSNGETKLLKLFDFNKLHKTQYTTDGDVLEIEILRNVNHPNIVRLEDDGSLLIDNQKYAYAIFEYISGETLADKMSRENTLNSYETKDVLLGVLNGLNYLHNLDKPVIHNEITNLNVMLDLSGKVPIPRIIDFGYARYLEQSNKAFMKEGLSPYYLANEAYNGVFSLQTDIFSAGVLYFHLLQGLPPWVAQTTNSKATGEELEELISFERQKTLRFVDEGTASDDLTQRIISKSLHPNAPDRFRTCEDFIKAIHGELEIEKYSSSIPTNPTLKPKKTKAGEGFKAIAGMQDLKDTIKRDVIDALNDKEKYASYGLTIPNGMLLYGPPGCGKTFFAERMAEEIGFNFYQIKPSDIQSKFVNESQENIKNLFDEARENAPSIIFIDELDAVVPNRDNSSVNHMNTSAVNEFLAQMNNCGEDDIFVIGATNRPTAIDPAILRAGRLDKTVYLPPPDKEARSLMFKLYLDKRPRELGLDYDSLADMTENYMSSDIKYLCDEASREALKLSVKISMDILKGTISSIKPSISLQVLKTYDTLKSKMEGIDKNDTERPKIGF